MGVYRLRMPSVGELLIILAILLLLFGATRLPKLARSMGQANKEFKAGIKDGSPESRVKGPCPFCGTDVPAKSSFCPGCSKSAEEIVAKRSEDAKNAGGPATPAES